MTGCRLSSLLSSAVRWHGPGVPNRSVLWVGHILCVPGLHRQENRQSSHCPLPPTAPASLQAAPQQHPKAVHPSAPCGLTIVISPTHQHGCCQETVWQSALGHPGKKDTPFWRVLQGLSLSQWDCGYLGWGYPISPVAHWQLPTWVGRQAEDKRVPGFGNALDGGRLEQGNPPKAQPPPSPWAAPASLHWAPLHHTKYQGSLSDRCLRCYSN